MPKHNLEELDKGQLDFMWNFLRFKCGQQSNIPALKKTSPKEFLKLTKSGKENDK